MIDQPARDLLLDLARLAQRHPPEAWESILGWLDDDSRRAGLVSLLSELAEVSVEVKHRARRGVNAPAVSVLLDEALRDNPAQGQLLEGFWRRLVTRDILPTLSSIRTFAEIAGLRKPNSSKREQAINDLMRQLASWPQDEIADVLEKTSMGSQDFGEDYQRWVALILGRRATTTESM